MMSKFEFNGKFQNIHPVIGYKIFVRSVLLYEPPEKGVPKIENSSRKKYPTQSLTHVLKQIPFTFEELENLDKKTYASDLSELSRIFSTIINQQVTIDYSMPIAAENENGLQQKVVHSIKINADDLVREKNPDITDEEIANMKKDLVQEIFNTTIDFLDKANDFEKTRRLSSFESLNNNSN